MLLSVVHVKTEHITKRATLRGVSENKGFLVKLIIKFGYDIISHKM